MEKKSFYILNLVRAYVNGIYTYPKNKNVSK